MRIGTKTLLFGNHQPLIHSPLVLVAWIKLYGLPNWKELICIAIHDLGYWGLPNLDGEEGEDHPDWAASWAASHLGDDYADLCRYHSRFKSQKCGKSPSKLCLPDKYGVALTPTWLWVFLGRLTGEIDEYQANTKYEIYHPIKKNHFEWFRDYKKICRKWVESGDLTIGRW